MGFHADRKNIKKKTTHNKIKPTNQSQKLALEMLELLPPEDIGLSLKTAWTY